MVKPKIRTAIIGTGQTKYRSKRLSVNIPEWRATPLFSQEILREIVIAECQWASTLLLPLP